MSSSESVIPPVDALFVDQQDIATLLHDIDWAATPLGPMEAWPELHVILAGEMAKALQAHMAPDRFLDVVSHELQTPLTNIFGWSSHALHMSEPALMARAMEVVYRNAVRMQGRMAEILDFSRLAHHKLTLRCATLDLDVEAHRVVETLRQIATEHGLILHLEVPDEALPVWADAERLHQCLCHLLTNSINFTPAGGVVTVCCRRVGEFAECVVTDTGRGLSPEAVRQAFRAFHQVDRDERAGGLGLGLAITRGLIELHGGTIHMTSPGPDQGCTVTVRLPVQT